MTTIFLCITVASTDQDCCLLEIFISAATAVWGKAELHGMNRRAIPPFPHHLSGKTCGGQNLWGKHSTWSHVLSTSFRNHAISFCQWFFEINSISKWRGWTTYIPLPVFILILSFPGFSLVFQILFPCVSIFVYSWLSIFLNLVLEYLLLFHHSFPCSHMS